MKIAMGGAGVEDKERSNHRGRHLIRAKRKIVSGKQHGKEQDTEKGENKLRLTNSRHKEIWISASQKCNRFVKRCKHEEAISIVGAWQLHLSETNCRRCVGAFR